MLCTRKSDEAANGAEEERESCTKPESQMVRKFKPACSKRQQLTAEEAAEIFSLRPKTTNGSNSKRGSMIHCKTIGPKFGVSPKTIRDIWRGRTWTEATKHLWTPDERGRVTAQSFKPDPSESSDDDLPASPKHATKSSIATDSLCYQPNQHCNNAGFAPEMRSAPCAALGWMQRDSRNFLFPGEAVTETQHITAITGRWNHLPLNLHGLITPAAPSMFTAASTGHFLPPPLQLPLLQPQLPPPPPPPLMSSSDVAFVLSSLLRQNAAAAASPALLPPAFRPPAYGAGLPWPPAPFWRSPQ